MDVRNDSCTNFIHPLGGDGEHVLHALQVVSSLLTVAFWFVNVFCRRSARLRNLCIHPNLKVILVGSSLFILAHSASTFLLHLENLITSMIRDPCILTPVGWKCVLIATVVFFSDGGLFFMHLAIFIERLMATYYADRYEKFSGRNGAVGTVFLLVVNAAITAVGFYNADIPQGPRCVLFTKRNAERLVLVIFATMALDLLTIVGDFVLLVWNKKRMTKKLVDYKLAKAYQLQENRMTMRLIVPVAMLHLVTLIVYVALTLTASLSASEEHSDSENFRTFVLYAEGLRTTSCVYTAFAMMILFGLRRTIPVRNRVEPLDPHRQTELYFEQLSHSWTR